MSESQRSGVIIKALLNMDKHVSNVVEGQKTRAFTTCRLHTWSLMVCDWVTVCFHGRQMEISHECDK